MFKFLKQRKLDEIYIRFNTKNNGSNLIWRIFVNDKEFLASSILLKGTFFDKKTTENGIDKYNVSCFGYVVWDGTSAKVVSKKSFINKYSDWSKKDFFKVLRLDS